MFYNTHTWGGHTRTHSWSKGTKRHVNESFQYTVHALILRLPTTCLALSFQQRFCHGWVPSNCSRLHHFLCSHCLRHVCWPGHGHHWDPCWGTISSHASASLAPCKSLFLLYSTLLYSRYSFVFSAQHVPGPLPVLQSTCLHNPRRAAACGGHSLQLPGRGVEES